LKEGERGKKKIHLEKCFEKEKYKKILEVI